MVIKLIVGLGNIGVNYSNTRHNLGSKYVRLLAKTYQVVLLNNNNLRGYIGILKLDNIVVRLLIPNCYINQSGFSIAKCVELYKLIPKEILVVHDDLDLLPGKIRIKFGKKSYDSHRGVRNIVVSLQNNSNFYRLRIGIGRPINKEKIADFVLSKFSSYYEENIINNAIIEAIRYTESIVNKDFVKVMNKLHFL